MAAIWRQLQALVQATPGVSAAVQPCSRAAAQRVQDVQDVLARSSATPAWPRADGARPGGR